jgi:uncharacterized protein YuzE
MKNNNKFYKQVLKNRKLAKKIIRPRLIYDKKNDIFYLWFGGYFKVDSTIEVSSNMRFDVTKDERIVAVEIENFSKYLKGKKK